jgi:hypothetical protein
MNQGAPDPARHEADHAHHPIRRDASPRSKGDRALCDCIQQAADRTLSRAEQRRAARFFKDPDEAQQVRASKTDRDNEFWDRYRAFGEMAEAYCAR